jgi:hypothetical protein
MYIIYTIKVSDGSYGRGGLDMNHFPSRGRQLQQKTES